MTHTYAELKVSRATYYEVLEGLQKADSYPFPVEGHPIDMNEISLVCDDAPVDAVMEKLGWTQEEMREKIETMTLKEALDVMALHQTVAREQLDREWGREIALTAKAFEVAMACMMLLETKRTN